MSPLAAIFFPGGAIWERSATSGIASATSIISLLLSLTFMSASSATLLLLLTLLRSAGKTLTSELDDDGPDIEDPNAGNGLAIDPNLNGDGAGAESGPGIKDPNED